ncbi:hypothetical protein BCR35DRAFT_306401 [Leucosporidium creatinivorum]|uniref:DASH complex subunit Hsk3 like-domain-containing protein n=1 Tax=Leucosporidium creatinivorum TaxID=106004 RepID=A0A1Y2ETW1_9BASI|nr:hypothetical protein BCR35DRAFT_306401 [Leucosporidium creatinivorum]
MSFPAPQPQLSTKHRQIAQLSQQLALLSERTEQLERLTQTTAEQAKFMRSLGGHHAGWFMAANRILTPNDAPPEGQEQQ